MAKDFRLASESTFYPDIVRKDDDPTFRIVASMLSLDTQIVNLLRYAKAHNQRSEMGQAAENLYLLTTSSHESTADVFLSISRCFR